MIPNGISAVDSKKLIPKTASEQDKKKRLFGHKNLFSIFLCEMIIYHGSEISSIWFYTGKQREIGIPVAS
jgi:hypothetical protein